MQTTLIPILVGLNSTTHPSYYVNPKFCLDYLTEENLFEGLQNQEDNAFKCLYAKVYPSFLHFIKSNNGNIQDAEDCLQESFQDLFLNLKRGRIILGEAKLSTIVTGYARRKWLSVLGSARFKYNKPLGDEHNPGSDETYLTEKMHSDSLDMLRMALAKLDEKCRQVISMYYLESKSFREIGIILDVPEATAKMRKSRCMDKLKNFFKTI